MLEPNLQEIRVHEVRLRPAHRVYRAKGRSFGHDAQALYYRGELLGYSRDCIHAAARMLLQRGLAAPEDMIQTVWDESGTPSLRAKVGDAAKWTVVETRKRGPHLRHFHSSFEKVSAHVNVASRSASAKDVCEVTGQTDVSARRHVCCSEMSDSVPPRDVTQAPEGMVANGSGEGEG